jgi:hypothetical protein
MQYPLSNEYGHDQARLTRRVFFLCHSHICVDVASEKTVAAITAST